MKLGNITIDRAMFGKLPGLLSPAMMRAVTGLDDRDLKTLVEMKTISVFKMPLRKGGKRTNPKYYKTEAAKLMKFEI